MDVLETGIAHFGPGVEAEHGVDGFRELGAAAFVDVACVTRTEFPGSFAHYNSVK